MATNERVLDACEMWARTWCRRDAGNATQEALLEVLEVERDRGPISLGLALAVARRRVLRTWRNEAAARRKELRYLLNRRRRDRDRPDTSDVPDLLSRLGTNELLAVKLRLWDGMSSKESAEAMDCTDKAARARFDRAVWKLRSIYNV